MKSKSMYFLLAVFGIIGTVFVITTGGCKKEGTTQPPVITPITDDLYPLIVGRQITYSGFLRDPATDTNITATGAFYMTKWLVVDTNAAVPIGGTSNLLLDSTHVSPGVWVRTPIFIRRTPPTGSANFSFLQNIGPFYRRFYVERGDSIRWILIAKLDAGMNNEWTAFDSTWTTSPNALPPIPPNTPVRLQIVGKFEGRETLTLGGQTFNDTYKLTTRRKIYLGGSSTPSVDAPTATIWLAPNIGPVKMILNADGESYGHFREYTSRNF